MGSGTADAAGYRATQPASEADADSEIAARKLEMPLSGYLTQYYKAALLLDAAGPARGNRAGVRKCELSGRRGI